MATIDEPNLFQAPALCQALCDYERNPLPQGAFRSVQEKDNHICICSAGDVLL